MWRLPSALKPLWQKTIVVTTVYVPIANTTEQQKRGVQPKKGWYLYDFDRLKTADRLVVLMLDGWEDSIGVALEIAYALGKGFRHQLLHA